MLPLFSLGRSVPWEGRRSGSRQWLKCLRAYSLDLLSSPKGGLSLWRTELVPGFEPVPGHGTRRAARPLDAPDSPARCSRLPSSGFSLSSLSGFYRQLLVGDINCPDQFIDNFDVTEHQRNYPPVQNVKSEKKQALRRDPTVRRHCGGSGPRQRQCGLLCLFS